MLVLGETDAFLEGVGYKKIVLQRSVRSRADTCRESLKGLDKYQPKEMGRWFIAKLQSIPYSAGKMGGESRVHWLVGLVYLEFQANERLSQTKEEVHKRKMKCT